MKKLIAVLFVLLSFSAMADDLQGYCGDVSSTYITSKHRDEMSDFTHEFAQEHLSKESLQALKDEGYDYIIGGRNCVLGKEYNIQIIIAMSGKKPYEIVDFGPLTIYGASFELKGITEQDIYEGIVFSGKSKAELSGQDGKTMTLKTGRGYGKTKIIIQYNDFWERVNSKNPPPMN